MVLNKFSEKVIFFRIPFPPQIVHFHLRQILRNFVSLEDFESEILEFSYFARNDTALDKWVEVYNTSDFKSSLNNISILLLFWYHDNTEQTFLFKFSKTSQWTSPEVSLSNVSCLFSTHTINSFTKQLYCI